MNGVIKFYNEQKGFGFIIPNEGDVNGGDNVFFHITNCAGVYSPRNDDGSENYDQQIPQDGDVVSFDLEVGPDRDGNERTSAVNVAFVSTGEEAGE